jgi:hypothetical protein
LTLHFSALKVSFGLQRVLQRRQCNHLTALWCLLRASLMNLLQVSMSAIHYHICP